MGPPPVPCLHRFREPAVIQIVVVVTRATEMMDVEFPPAAVLQRYPPRHVRPWCDHVPAMDTAAHLREVRREVGLHVQPFELSLNFLVTRQRRPNIHRK